MIEFTFDLTRTILLAGAVLFLLHADQVKHWLDSKGYDETHVSIRHAGLVLLLFAAVLKILALSGWQYLYVIYVPGLFALGSYLRSRIRHAIDTIEASGSRTVPMQLVARDQLAVGLLYAGGFLLYSFLP